MSRFAGSRPPPVLTSVPSSPSSSFHPPDSPGRYGDEHAPSRPERSIRRPLGSASSPSGFTGLSEGRFADENGTRRPSGAGSFRSLGKGGAGGGGSTSRRGTDGFLDLAPSSSMVRSGSDHSGGGFEDNGTGSATVSNKTRRMMDSLRKGGRSTSPVINKSTISQPLGSSKVTMDKDRNTPSNSHPGTRRASVSSNGSTSSSRSRSQKLGSDGEEEEVGVMGVTQPTMALSSAVEAFSKAGVRRDGRRGGLADQGFDALDGAEPGAKVRSTALDPSEYPDSAAFREVQAVLRKVATEWPVVTRGTTADAGKMAGEFDPVSLALGLLDPNNAQSRNSLTAFLDMKDELDHAITNSLSDGDAGSTSSYRAFETSISTHNSTLQSLTANQKQIVDLKKTLTNAREMLEGKGRDGLSGMYNRMTHLEEMLKLLDEIDHFRSIPDRLEVLLSEKRFLSAVVLLVRSLKTIRKPEMMEIGALTDLRSWLVLQEGVVLEILIEELHNHLYLKSFYCDVRWKPYSRGQTALPVVDFGEDVEVTGAPSHLEASFHSSGRSNARLPRLTKLQRYLNYLSLRPSVNPLHDEPIDNFHDSLSPSADDGSSAADGAGGASATGGDKFDSFADKKRTTRNLELDSFAYIEMLMECLACLGKLGHGLDAITQRVQSEMFQLVESTVEEVDERNDSTKQQTGIAGINRPQSLFFPASTGASGQDRGGLASLSSLTLPNGIGNRSSLLRLTASETTALESNVETLKDFFWTLYSKLDAVLQGFRVAYEVSLRITERRDFKDVANVKSSSGNLLFSLLDIWKPVQQEVRSLLHDYLTDDQSGTVSSRNPIVSVNEVLRLARPRDHQKQIFKFTDSDLKASSKVMKAHEDELNRTLKLVLPGLMTDGAGTSPAAAMMLASDDRYGGNARSGLAGTHKALVSADAFNVSILFGPTLSFLSRVREVMPGGLVADYDGATGFGGFLDDFVVRTFLPQLEEKVSHVFHQAVGGLDAFQEDPNYRKISNVPIVRSVSNLMMLISSLTTMLQATPFHRESYSHLIVSVIHQFFQRCNERYKDLVTREPSDAGAALAGGDKPALLKTSANWASMPELSAVLGDLFQAMPDNKSAVEEQLQRETKIEMDKKRNGVINIDDLITPSKKLLALGTLYSSLDWFIVHVAALKHVNEKSNSSASTEDQSASSPTMDQSDDGHSSTGPFSLPLTTEMTKPFESLLKSYRQLANQVLFTLRLEIRLRTIHYLDRATRDGVYQLSEDTAEPDPSVVDLNSDLAECDECAATTLAEPERKFIFEGLSLLMDQLLISNARYIRLANPYGLSKMLRNILALQQNLKNLGDAPLEVNFDRSRKFWDVFGRGPKEMLESIRAGKIKYDFEDYKALLNLMCGVDQSSKDGTTAGLISGGGSGDAAPLSANGDRSRRMYNEYLIDLFALDVAE